MDRVSKKEVRTFACLGIKSVSLIFKTKWLKDKPGVDEIIFKRHPYQLLNTNREFSPCFDAPQIC